ncbi:DEAD/DEAH box helicase [uncultured Thiothrix sp.]|uniref:DEAD/DEAH box helicase n=1 Tax=uncultured Thiothrix sp. TaxID=223185 RepID=UPI0026325F15|nr:DEAD/DEAH box helicase [uncultured Thiothrix sp.]
MLRPEHIRALRQHGFPPEMVLVSFDATTIQRGVHYFEAKRVIELSSDFPSLSEVRLKGLVLGNSKYSTDVLLDLNNHQVISNCSCPVGHQCKHAVATLLQYVGDRIQATATKTITEKLEEPTAIQLWLADLNTAPREAEDNTVDESADAVRMDLIYLLEQRNKLSNHVEITPRKATRLKRGGYGQAYQVQLEDLIYAWKNHPFHYQEIDSDISQLIVPHTSYYSSNSRQLELKGSVGLIALEMLLKTGRTFWKTTEHLPLKAGAARNLDIYWEEKGNTSQIRHRTIPPIQDYFWLEKLFYVDQLRGECGVLEHGSMTAVQVLKLLSAPPIPTSDANLVSQRLLDILPEAEIPLPDASMNPQVVELDDLVPVAHALLYIPADQTASFGQHRIRLSFKYGDHHLHNYSTQSIQTLRDDNIRYRIHRDLDFEQNALDQLQLLGFEGSGQNPLELRVPSDNPSLQALRWNYLLEKGLADLELDGWEIEYSDNFSLEFTTIDDWEAELASSGENWFEISLGFVVDGKRINLLPILVDMIAQMHDPQELKKLLQDQQHLLIPLDDKHWVKLDSQRLTKILDTLIELYDHAPLNAEGNLLIHQVQGLGLTDLLNDSRLIWKGAEELRTLSKQLVHFQGIRPVDLPKELRADLRPYQYEGLNWLQFLREYHFNGVLADDMGLGKTLQALAHLLIEKEAGRADRPSLVIAPTSLMSNWRREAEKFTPSLRVLTLHGPEREQHFEQLAQYDLVLTTYALVLRDEELYRQHQFHYLILDEAQAIKNAKAKTTQVIYELNARHRLCLTGTPMENHLGELWSMFRFLMPGFLGPLDRFGRLFRVPIEKHGDPERQLQLRKRLQPFMLRRTKEHVAKELPPKTEIIRTVALEGVQRDLYESVRLAMDKKLREEINQKGFARSQIMILDALLKLRQVCCDPRLLKLDSAQGIQASAKLEMLMEMLLEMLDEGRKVLLFSQFTSMLELIEHELVKNNIPFSKLTGQTRDRETAINYFQEGAAKVFLISLKAGGTGLNLTAADTVIHYDPWWNPAVEQQATDRAYRIGQEKPVFVYKLLTEETVEEKILKLQERKQSLADGLYTGANQAENNFNQDDLLELLKPLSLP